jgi:hypothetical protein
VQEVQVFSKEGWNMTSSEVNPVLAVARVIAARSTLGRDISALSPQVTHISRASQETAAVWGKLVPGNFWQTALFRAYLERIVEGWLFLHMELSLAGDPHGLSTLLQQAAEPSGVALPTSVAETRTEPYYVEKNLGPESASHSSSAKPVWQVVYEARHSHRQVFRIARKVQNPQFLSIILGLQPEEEAALSNLEAVATRSWELARLLMAAEGTVNMENLANRVERSFSAPMFIGRGSSTPRQEVYAELQHAVEIGRGQKISGPKTPSPSPKLESKEEYGTGVTLCFDETVIRDYGYYQCPECATTKPGGANIGPYPHKPQCKKRKEGYKGCLYFFGIQAMRHIQDWSGEHGNESREPENHLSFQELVASLGEDFVEEKLGK